MSGPAFGNRLQSRSMTQSKKTYICYDRLAGVSHTGGMIYKYDNAYL